MDFHDKYIHPLDGSSSTAVLRETPVQTSECNLQEETSSQPPAVQASVATRAPRDVRSYTVDADWKPQTDDRSYSISEVAETCATALEHVNLDEGMGTSGIG
jgi:hypothetical protein